MEFNVFDSIKIGLASPEKSRSGPMARSKPETINYRTLKPERDGLFCERIFGPYQGLGVLLRQVQTHPVQGQDLWSAAALEVTRSKVRRERMGHIELAAPVSHIWYFAGNLFPDGPPLLNMSPAFWKRCCTSASTW